MADGVTIDNGSGTDFKVATDDSGAGGHIQLVKLTYSADGVATPIPADENGMAVQDTTIAAILTTIDADVGYLPTIDADTSLLSAATQAIGTAVGSTDRGVVIVGIRDDALSTLTPAEGDAVPIRVNDKGAQWVIEAGAWSYTTDSVAIGSVAGQGYTPQQFIDVDESEDEVKGSAGTLHALVVTNQAAATRYLKIYDGTASGVTVGSTTPKWTVPIPAGAGFVWESAIGIAMATGITIAATTGVAVADTGAPAANDVVVNVGYK